MRQDTKDLCQLTLSSVPPHVTAMLGEVQELFELTSRSAALLSIPNLQPLCAFEGSSFDNTRFAKDPTPELLGIYGYIWDGILHAEKHPSGDRRIKNGTLYLIYISISKVYDDYVSRYFDFVLPEIARLLASGETIRFVPKFKRRRGQEQLRLAFQSGDGEVWECKKCDPPTYHVVHTEHKGKKHKCRSRVGVAQPHKMIADVGVTISTSLSDQPKRLQRNLEVLRDYRQQRASYISVCIILFRLVNGRVSLPPNRNNCSCVPLFCACTHRYISFLFGLDFVSNSQIPVYNPLKQQRLRVAELRLWWYKTISSFFERPFVLSEWKLLVTPPCGSDWTRVTAQMYIEDRTNKLWGKCPSCGKHKSEVKRLAALQEREEKLRRENKALSDEAEKEISDIRTSHANFEFHVRAKNNKRFYDEDLKLCARDLAPINTSPELKHSVTKVPDLKKLHCFEATSTPGTLQVSFFRDENKQKFVFHDEGSSSRPRAAWMPSPAAMACILQPAALPQWPIEFDDLPSQAVPAAAPRSHEKRGWFLLTVAKSNR
eukprot:g27672.t1